MFEHKGPSWLHPLLNSTKPVTFFTTRCFTSISSPDANLSIYNHKFMMSINIFLISLVSSTNILTSSTHL